MGVEKAGVREGWLRGWAGSPGIGCKTEPLGTAPGTLGRVPDEPAGDGSTVDGGLLELVWRWSADSSGLTGRTGCDGVEPGMGLLIVLAGAIAGLGNIGLAVGATVTVLRIGSGLAEPLDERLAVGAGFSNSRSVGAIADDTGRPEEEPAWLGDLSASGRLSGETSGSSSTRGVPVGNRRAPSTGRLSMSI